MALERIERTEVPTLENRRKVVDAYLAAFKKTPLVMLIGGGECLKYACATARAGGPTAWATWAAFRNLVPHAAGLSRLDQGSGHPRRLEDCSRGLGNLLGYAEMGERGLVAPLHLQLRPGLPRLGHQQQVGPAAPTATMFGPRSRRFLRRLGYRLVLKELKHPAQVRAGGQARIVHEMAERGLGPLLPAVSRGLSPEQ